MAVLLYAYSLGSGRADGSSACASRMWRFECLRLTRGDHATIARFRQTLEKTLASLFTQVLSLCAEVGLVMVEGVELDGTKIKANASLAANRTTETIKQAVTTMLAEAQTVDEAEEHLCGPDRRGDELPKGLRERTSRLKRLQACQERLEHETAEATPQ